jgi:hypothetical protein
MSKPKWRNGLRATGMGGTKQFEAASDEVSKNPSIQTGFDAAEENLYNQGFVIRIEHVPTKRTVEFSAFITDQSDAFTSNWTEETVFGRMDPIATFESTKRVSSLGFSVPSFSQEQAANNLARINTLLSMLYPTYTAQGGDQVGTTVNMGPLVRIKYANIIDNADNPGKGLLGYITTGITVTPDLEAGLFASTGKASATKSTGQEILYKSYNLNFELSVLHEHSLGFVKGTTHGGASGWVFRSKKGAFPYQNKKHLPYTIHGMDFSNSNAAAATNRSNTAAAQAAAVQLSKDTNAFGEPNSTVRKKLIKGMNKSGKGTIVQAKIYKLLQSVDTGPAEIQTFSGREYALENLSASDFSKIHSGLGSP